MNTNTEIVNCLVHASTKPTAAWKRILRLMNERPGLVGSGTHSSLSSRVDLFDDDDGLWASWTTEAVLDGMAAAGLWPTYIMDKNGQRLLVADY